MKQTSPAVVDELIPGQMKLAEVQQILQMLLARAGADPPTWARFWKRWATMPAATKDPMLLTEYVRHRLARAICTRYRDADNRLYVVTLDPALEDRIRAGFEHNERGLFIRMSPQAVEATCRLIAEEIEKLDPRQSSAGRAGQPADPRRRLRQMTTSHLPQLVVLSYNEITRDTQIESLAMVTDVGTGAKG